jgi:hypothetical protein
VAVRAVKVSVDIDGYPRWTFATSAPDDLPEHVDAVRLALHAARKDALDADGGVIRTERQLPTPAWKR